MPHVGAALPAAATDAPVPAAETMTVLVLVIVISMVTVPDAAQLEGSGMALAHTVSVLLESQSN